MDKQGIIESSRKRREGERIFYTSCPANGCWDSACVLKCHEKDGKIIAIEPDDSVNPAAHYMQLLAASESEDVTEAYLNGRVQLDQAVGRILKHAGVDMPSHIVGVVVDGAAVTAVSEGRDVRELAAELLKDVLLANASHQYAGNRVG